MDETVETVAFAMTLNPGAEAEYLRRHDEIWPDLVAALRSAGVLDYRIYLDTATLRLFAVMTRRRGHSLDALSQTALMRRWWDMMGDIMRTNPDGSPTSDPLPSAFDLAAH